MRRRVATEGLSETWQRVLMCVKMDLCTIAYKQVGRAPVGEQKHVLDPQVDTYL